MILFVLYTWIIVIKVVHASDDVSLTIPVTPVRYFCIICLEQIVTDFYHEMWLQAVISPLGLMLKTDHRGYRRWTWSVGNYMFCMD